MEGQVHAVLPAYAGMIPPISLSLSGVPGAPRVCGDDPLPTGYLIDAGGVLPAYAGMIRA